MPDASRPLRQSLLHGVSFSALLIATAAGTTARAASYRSLNQAINAAPASAAANAAAGLTAARQAGLGMQSLASATARFRSLQQALGAIARPAIGSVPDGYGAGGLQIGDGVSSNGGKSVTNATLWNGAALPSTSQTSPDVTVVQTAPLANLTWKTFNVGPKTHLTFDQNAGGSQRNQWLVINTVQDPLANPSQIEGEISAPGKVYVLNRNGVAFGAGSQINVGSLIASTASIASSQFTKNADGSQNFSLYGAQAGSGYAPTFSKGLATADITVSPGAVITTATPTSGTGGGYVMLLGGNVVNAGTIMTPQGQTVLAGGTAFTLRPGSTGSTTTGNTTSTTLGSEVAATNIGTSSATGTGTVFASGSVLNSGLIVSDQGDISLVGHALTQSGVLMSTTTVNTRGTIHFLTNTTDTTASIVLADNSVTEVLPEDDGSTALDSQRAANIAASAVLNAARLAPASTANPLLGNNNTLPDQVGEGRIELWSGGTVDVAAGALALAQGGQVAVGAGSSVLLESGSTIDVSGTTTAVLPAKMNELMVSVQPYQLRDSAANRDGALKSTNVVVDARLLEEVAGTGPYAGNIYTPGGLLEVGGYVGLVPHRITEWTALGGQVTLQAQSTTKAGAQIGGTITAEAGSVINVEGGLVNYAAGPVQQTYVMATDGSIHNINEAPSNLVYTGLYTGDMEVHPRWHVTEVFNNPLLTPTTIEEAAYSVGRDAGTLTVNASAANLMGTVTAGVSAGIGQTGARPASLTDAYLLAQTVVPLAGTLRLGNYVGDTLLGGISSAVTFGSAADAPAPGSIVTASATGTSTGGTSTTGTSTTGTSTGGTTTTGTVSAGTSFIDSGSIGAAGFANVVVTTSGDITVSSPLAVADGGTISLVGSTIEANASLTARGGAIILSNQLALTSAPVGSATPSISLAAGAVLDARGVWTNAVLDPVHVAGEALVHGGTVTIQGDGAVDLATGSTIDVSSGGALLAGGKLQQAAGGSVSVTADIEPLFVSTSATAAVTLGANFIGYGTSGGGTLSLEAPEFRIGGATAVPVATDVVFIAPSLFQSGFASYVLNGTSALSVAADEQVTVAEPVFALANPGGTQVPTGGDPGQVFSVILPGVYTPSRGGDTVAQRGGASITLLSSVDPTTAGGGGGDLTLGAGSSITVDPGQSITVVGYGSVAALGTLTTHGGHIIVANSNFDDQTDRSGTDALHYKPGTTLVIGNAALLDASGQAPVFVDALGRRFTTQAALAGGSIALGGDPATGHSTYAPVDVEAGAMVNAGGASAVVDVVPLSAIPSLIPSPKPTLLAGAGGTFTVASIDGFSLNGLIEAGAGGSAAAGGVLSLRIDPISLSSYADVPGALFTPREILVSTDIAPATVTAASPLGIGSISQAQIDSGGFDTVSLTAQDAVVFEGNVSLHAGRSVAFFSGLVGDATASGTVSVTAPVVSFSSITAGDANGGGTTSVQASTGVFSVSAGLIEFSEDVVFGGTKSFGSPPSNGGTSATGTTAVVSQANTYGFADAAFDSASDIRFLGSASATGQGFVESAGNLTFAAAQLLPATQKTTSIYAGLNPAATGTVSALAGGTITVLRSGGAVPEAFSIGGTLALVADTVLQGGIVHAPEGTIRLGYNNFDDLLPNQGVTVTSTVVLEPGSVTSVSLAGQTIPFGGTVDGVNYLVAGATAPLFKPDVEIDSETVTAKAGAALDLRGGGTLAGAGFVVGRGGSADVLTTPLLDIAGAPTVPNALSEVPAIVPLNSGDAVYAILPSYAGAYAPAPTAQDAGYKATAAGEQITVGSQIPGLAAGTYTLLPAYYALLPGGFRVELTSGTLPAGTLQNLGNFATVAPITVGFAGTAIHSQVPVAALFTDGAGVRQLSQYDEESYNAFETNAGVEFGTPRPFLPQDAKTLLLNYPAQIATGSALTFDPGALLKAPAAGGYGMTLEVNTSNPIEVTAAGMPAASVTGSQSIATGGSTGGSAAAPTTLALDAGVLSGLDVPRLLLGGTFSINGNQVDLVASAPSVTIDPHATLRAGDVMLVVQSAGSITVSSGATLSTVGEGSAAFDLTQGFYFNNQIDDFTSSPVLDVSNGQIVFTPNRGAAAGASITIADDAALLSSGSLDFVAPTGASVAIGNALLGGRYVNIQVSTLNLGSPTALADYARLEPGELPPGLTLSQTALDLLLSGDTAAGVPAASSLVLTANLATNIIGNATPLTQWAPATAYAPGQTVLNNGQVYVCIAAGTSSSAGGPSGTGTGTVADGSAVWQFQNAAGPVGTDLNAYTLAAGSTALVLNTPAIYGWGAAGDSAVIQASSFTWNGVLTQNLLQVGPTTSIAASALPAGQIAGSAANVAPSLAIQSGTIIFGYGPQTQPNNQVQLDRLIAGFAKVTLQASGEITANSKNSLSVFASEPAYGQPGNGGDLTLSTPLLTTSSAAVLKITAGGALTIAPPAGSAPAPTGSVTTLGGEIDLVATSIDASSAIALPAGRFSATAQDNITLDAGAAIDLAGRSTTIFDKTAQSPGGTLLLESTAGSITQAPGSLLDVSSPGADAGSIGVTALAGVVGLDGSLAGDAVAGHTAGSFTVIAGSLTATAGASGFDALNSALDTGGFTGARSFEIANGDIAIDQPLHASALSVTADAGNVTVTKLLDASGATPGSISINASGNLTLGKGAVLDAHATKTAVDSYGEEIDASNRAHVTLTSVAGRVILDSNTVIDVSYPDSSRPQGQVVVNAPRELKTAGIAVDAPGSVTILGAQSVALYAWKDYAATSPNGAIATASTKSMPDVVALNTIKADNLAWAAGLTGDGIKAQLGGLTGPAFHLRPGAEIDSTAASGGTLTVTGDLDFSTLRISDPAGYGSVFKALGSGEPGAVVFRASGQLIVNGSITDGFAAPPDSKKGDNISQDNGWVVLASSADPLNADVYLPSTVTITYFNGRRTATTSDVLLKGISKGASTSFDTTRAISLNYPITIRTAAVAANVVIPFAATLATTANGDTVVPAGGFVATAALTTPTHTYARGDFVPGGTILPAGTVIAANSVLPVSVQVSDGTAVPAGTLLNIFADQQITLFQNTGILPVNAFIPSNTVPLFLNGDPSLTKATPVGKLELRPTIGTTKAQGYLYPLAALLPAGSQSWDLNLVAGANLASANRLAVLPHSQLGGGALAPAATLASQTPGSLLLDDQHYAVSSNSDFGAVAAFSVIRTGTGDLNLVAGGNFDQSSLYGIYTAGTQTYLDGKATDKIDASFNLARQPQGKKGALLPGAKYALLDTLISKTYAANYPNGGGDLSMTVQGSATGDLYDNAITGLNGAPSSAEVGNWLWRQGSTQDKQNTAWWINFGTFTIPYTVSNTPEVFDAPQLVGFQGIGTLGGGNLTVTIGGDAGQITDRSGINSVEARGEGLVFAVASTGRFPSGAAPVITGGGSLTLRIGGTLNPLDAAAYGTDAFPEVNGAVIDLRGNIDVSAGAVGRIDTVYNGGVNNDPRAVDPFSVSSGVPEGGLTLIPGDGIVQVETLRDLVIEGAADAGRVADQNLTVLTKAVPAKDSDTGGDSAFTLWQADTSISLFSAGGNVTPTSQPSDSYSLDGTGNLINYNATDFRVLYPPTLLVTAAAGSIIYGNQQSGNNALSLETMPSATGQVAFLAGTSIIANDFAIDISGANPTLLATPLSPNFTSNAAFLQASLTNIRAGGGTPQDVLALFGQEADTPTTDLHAADPVPALFYAGTGDIMNLITGETITYTKAAKEPLAQWYLAAKPVRIMAGEDIVSSGTRPGTTPGVEQQNQQTLVQTGVQYATASGDLFYNTAPTSISVVSAGRDILSGYFYVGGASAGGAGLLEVDAGHNLFQAAATSSGTQTLDFGVIKSIGALISGAPVTGGADVSVLTGVGSDPNYSVFANLYLDPANQADLSGSHLITDASNKGHVQATYQDALYTYLVATTGYAGPKPDTEMNAKTLLATFEALPQVDQNLFLREVFFNETNAAGLQYNDASSRFYHSYARGRLAIDTFFLPLNELNNWLNKTIDYTGGTANAAATFAALPAKQSQPFLDAIFSDDEASRSAATAGVSPAFSSLLGMTDTKSPGVPDGYNGTMTMFSGPVTAGATALGGGGLLTNADGTPATFDAGISSSSYGGSLQVLNPGGQIVLGVAGSPAPGASSGVITNGIGDIDIYALGSVLLGKSRIFTTDGGNILIWSSEGDINAGIGAKTTVVFNPPIVNYDPVGDIVETPAIPSSGAGIATLQPLPGILPGNVDLVAPLGTIDAGEAGIRVAGNLNLAAERIANGANFAVGGLKAGFSTVSIASIGAVAAASASAGAATNAAQNSATSHAQEQEPSLLEVDVLSVSGGDADAEKRKRRVP